MYVNPSPNKYWYRVHLFYEVIRKIIKGRKDGRKGWREKNGGKEEGRM